MDDQIEIGRVGDFLVLQDNITSCHFMLNLNDSNPTFEFTDVGLNVNSEKIDLSSVSEEFKEYTSTVIKAYLDVIEKQDLLDEANETFSDCCIPSESVIRELNKDKYKLIEEAAINIFNITKEVYGENCRLKINHQNNEFDIYILFPEITISNTVKQSRLLKDIVVQIQFYFTENKYVLRETIKGTRLSVGKVENSSGYVHSHLPRTQTGAFNKFCLGATEIAATNTDLMLPNKYSDTKYKLFLHMIDNYLRHESLEGVPFIAMSKIKPLGLRYTLQDTLKKSLDKKVFEKFKVIFNDTSKEFDITRSDTFITEIKEYLNSINYNKTAYMVYNIQGDEYTINSLTVNNNSTLSYDDQVEDVAALFNITPSLYDDHEDITANEELSTELLNYVCNNLKKQINNHYIKIYANS